jgi:putative SOS response-associated peptidase YedK
MPVCSGDQRSHSRWRCLVPVTEFQQWSIDPMPETGKKKQFWFKVPSQLILAFAGIQEI